MEKRAYLPRMFSETDITTMKNLHRAIDPDNLSNPGKMFLERDMG